MTSPLVIIPARGGSKRLPGKNLKLLAGRSLMQWTADALTAAGFTPDQCLLSTDDADIAAEGRRLRWQVPWLRPAELATDTATSLDAVLHAVDWWRSSKGRDPEIVLLLQVTSPFRDPTHLRRALDMLESTPDLDAVIAAADLHRTPASLFTVRSGRLKALGSGTDGNVVTPNGSFYAIRTAVLRSERTFFPRNLAAITMDARHSIDIDTPADFAMAEALAAAQGAYASP